MLTERFVGLSDSVDHWKLRMKQASFDCKCQSKAMPGQTDERMSHSQMSGKCLRLGECSEGAFGAVYLCPPEELASAQQKSSTRFVGEWVNQGKEATKPKYTRIGLRVTPAAAAAAAAGLSHLAFGDMAGIMRSGCGISELSHVLARNSCRTMVRFCSSALLMLALIQPVRHGDEADML